MARPSRAAGSVAVPGAAALNSMRIAPTRPVPMLLGLWIATAAAVGVAVTRHGLYAIEHLVNRTLVYVALTALLVAAYAAITIGLGVLVGGDSPWVIALATLAVAEAHTARHPSGRCAHSRLRA